MERDYKMIKYSIGFAKKSVRSSQRVLRQIGNLFLPNMIKAHKQLEIKGSVWSMLAYQKLKITGKGKVTIGKSCAFGAPLGGYYHKGLIELQSRYADSKIVIGDNVATNNNLFICCKERIVVGDDCLIGHNVVLMDFDGHPIDPTMRRKSDGLFETITIGKNVWIGNNVTILRGTQIGDNSVVATGAVVKGKFPSNVIIGGVPARVIRDIQTKA